MATSSREPDTSLIAGDGNSLEKVATPLLAGDVMQRLWAEPYAFEFFQAVRLLQTLSPDQPQVGRAARPSQDIVRFLVNPTLVFPASAIHYLGRTPDADKGEAYKNSPTPIEDDSAYDADGVPAPLAMIVNFMGVVGPMGTLPIYYTQLVGGEAAAGNTAPRDFLDTFHHRIISLFYLAWEKYRQSSGSGATILSCLYDLVGMGTPGLRGRTPCPVPDESLAFYAGLLSQQPRSAVALRNVLKDYFGVTVEIEQFVGRWCPLDKEEQSALDEGAEPTYQLAGGAVLGDEVWEPQARVRVVLGPLHRDQYLDFLPTGKANKELRGLLRFFGKDEIDFELRLILRREDAPGCQLGAEDSSAPRLGWFSWAKTREFANDPADALVEM